MGVWRRADSPYWWLWLEKAPKGKQRRPTDILIGVDAESRKASKDAARKVYAREMLKLGEQAHGLASVAEPILFSVFATWYDAQVIAHHRGKVREREILATLIAAFGSQHLHALTRDGLIEWRTLRAAKTSNSTANRECAVLKHLLKSAVPRYLESSPLAGVKPLRPVRRETHVLSCAEETKLLKELTVIDTAIVLAGLDAMLRLSDVVNLRRDQDRGSYLVIVDPKVQPYRVPISKRLRKALNAVPKEGAWFFPTRRRDDPVRMRALIKNMLWRACERAGIDYGRKAGGITFHGLRHTGATRMVDAGVPLRVVQELGGWKSMRQLERYAHPTEAAKVAAVESVGRNGHNQTRSRSRE